MSPVFGIMALMMVATATVSEPSAPVDRLPVDRLYACGDDQVREYRIDRDGAAELWRWSAGAARDLPASYRTRLMAHIDDCKPVDAGRAILVTSSTGGVVLIERATGKVRFRAKTPMAHSADVLPDGRVAVALSIDPAGDRLEIYDRARSERVLLHLPLPSGHGAVWDDARSRLFVLSHDLIQAFSTGGTRAAPVLTEVARWTLPGRRDGHDLSRRPDSRFFVTTDDGVWTFDPDTGSFAAFEALNPKLRVKAVSAHGDSIAWVQAEESWWAYGFTIARRDGSAPRRIPVAGMHLYKVRWIP